MTTQAPQASELEIMGLMSIAMCSQFPDQFYGRVVGKILLNNTDVCLEQLKRGIA